ncbi:metallophosphoesterase family protein [Spirochaeta isovalerica]|uniref:Putative phosphoesterase n=1 Tax=Spirochaeta isovalerica TaxID=150 RepID=A0A841RDJ5_9SPIO|nr:metallophosphoesterase family protein [Spirochaeta isovalerica]MBB6480452.1 putative phosphoesterase [Spirochaeta isovalerica]
MNEPIAVMADIHGNLPAFLAIKEDLQKRGIERVIVAGDMISDCPDSDEVLTQVRLSDWIVIKGNREQYFIDHCAGLLDHWTHARQMSALMWTFDKLSRKNRAYIRTLADQKSIEIDGLSIRITHGSPDSLSELLYPDKEKERFGEVMDSIEEKLLICGHSHNQWFVEGKGKWALNPGSAGVHFNKGEGAQYALLRISRERPSAELISVPYSLKDLEKRFHESGLYRASPHWSRSIIESLKEGENLSLLMIDYALNLMEKEGIKDALTIPDHIWDRAGEEFLRNRG